MKSIAFEETSSHNNAHYLAESTKLYLNQIFGIAYPNQTGIDRAKWMLNPKMINL